MSGEHLSPAETRRAAREERKLQRTLSDPKARREAEEASSINYRNPNAMAPRLRTNTSEAVEASIKRQQEKKEEPLDPKDIIARHAAFTDAVETERGINLYERPIMGESRNLAPGKGSASRMDLSQVLADAEVKEDGHESE